MQGFLVVVVVGQAGPDMDLVDMGREGDMLQDQGLDMEQVLE